jgi:arabinan endo-1,5-alpha-L-arabinosidase
MSSAETDHLINQSGIFYATSSSGAPGSWTDHGLVISTSSGSNYNAIDPKCALVCVNHLLRRADMAYSLFISTTGNWYLQMGSFCERPYDPRMA